MISIGNDIVDLKDNDSDLITYHNRFFSRVLADEEYRFLIDNRSNKIEKKMFWTVWAIKEAAYKAIKRIDDKAIFQPKKYIVSENFNHVKYQDKKLQCIYDINEEFIHVICMNENIKQMKEENKIRYFTEFIDEKKSPGLNVRDRIKDELKAFYNLDIDLLFKNRVPFYELKNQKYPVSISHHGRYIAAAFLVD
ncbi:MAG: 4'-phosphopantetheinyl transferase superfamily protein [Spirochaetia bacterium]|nr:4'-phosphopantetheinyl transferase superfamily protein [Spirochaetia bacterium]